MYFTPEYSCTLFPAKSVCHRPQHPRFDCYSYICNTVSAYHKEPLQNPSPQSKRKEDAATTISGTYKDDDSKYSLRNLLKRQETEAGNED